MAANKDEQIKQFWDSFANSYESNYQKISDGLFILSLPLLDIKSSTAIVEAGCGAGTGLQMLRNQVPATVKIFANDLSDEMITRARSKNIENCEILVASNETLPFSNECCNKYISNLTLHLVNDPKKCSQNL